MFLGLTVDCARCHDHKIDPIPQKDYYGLLAFFQNITHYRNGDPTDQAPIFTDPSEKPAYAQRLHEVEQKRRGAEPTELLAIETDFTPLYDKEPDRPGGAGKKTLNFYERIARRRPAAARQGEGIGAMAAAAKGDCGNLSARRGRPATALCVTEMGRTAPDTFVLMRGNAHVPGDKVEPHFPQILTSTPPIIPDPPPDAKTCGRRLALANWIASKDDPMAARVMVNRLWQYHFGRGIVRSPNNFGFQGDKPTHPELLDWLASELVDSGWRLKPLHRMILLSNAYRMSSRGNAEALKADPVNDLFWRFDMRRLTAEEIRDSILAVSGNLNLKMYGPGIYPRSAEGGAGDGVDAGPRLGQIAAGGAGAAKRLCPRQAVAADADPGEFRPGRDGSHDAGALRHDAADAGADAAQQRVHATSRRRCSRSGCAGRPGRTWASRCGWGCRWPRRGRRRMRR